MNAIILVCIFGAILSIVSFMLGFYIRTIVNKLRTLEQGLEELAKQKLGKQEELPKSSFIDPTDPATIARLEHDEKIHLLNPDL